jgi:DNA invertase Pin-like site-specific DNA recombinase
MTLRAVGYVRVSLEEEHPENQVIAIQEYCKREGIELVQVFQDVGVSGAIPALKRPGFRQMLDFCKQNNIRVIIVYDVTRLGRDALDTAKTVCELTANGFYIIFVADPELSLDPRLPPEELDKRKGFFMFKVGVAHFERLFNARRTRQGMYRAWLQGKHVGRPPRSGKHVTPEIYKQIIEMCTQGIYKTEIAKKLGLSRHQVYYWVKKYEREHGTVLPC